MSSCKVEKIGVDRLAVAMLESGYAPAEAADHVDRGVEDWFRLTAPAPLPERLRAAMRGAGIVVYPARSGAPVYLLGGERAAYRALLRGCPDDPVGRVLGVELGVQLGLPVDLRPPTYIAGRMWIWGERTYIMGILNVTPDSFSDGGRFRSVDAALRHVERMVAERVDIVDIGGESTRPGADPVSAEEELARILPVIEAVKRRFDVPVSVDTYKAKVARQAVEAGADVVNDVSGLRADPAMAVTVAQLGVPVVLMHMPGTPKTMQLDPRYTSVVPEVREALQASVDTALQAGVRPENIILDPGFGFGKFGKTLSHNLTLLRRLRDLKRLGYPVLSGTSRKSMIGQILDLPVDQRIEGTAATVALAVAGLADIVRVHDVAAMRRVVQVADAVVRGEPA